MDRLKYHWRRFMQWKIKWEVKYILWKSERIMNKAHKKLQKSS